MTRPEPVNGFSLDRIPKITRLLVLGHHFENLVRKGAVKDYAEIARLTGLSRARVTQITNLTLLPPNFQERILFPTAGFLFVERDARTVAAPIDWHSQQ
jgi:hypothetical protein